MVRVGERVWAEWQRLLDEPTEPAVMMLLRLEGDHGDALRAVRAAVCVDLAAFQESVLESGDGERFIGEWTWLQVPDGVQVIVSDCYGGAWENTMAFFRDTMRVFADGVERRGVHGALELHDWPPSPTANSHLGHFLICHIRVRGERVSYEPPDHPWYSWRPDPTAHAAVIAAADRWCKQLGERADYDIRKATLGPVPFDYTHDTAARLREAFLDDGNGELRGTSGEARRVVGVGSYTGGIGLVVSGPDLDGGDWRPGLAELTELLRDNAGQIAHAYVRRGWLLSVSGTLDRDWPARADSAPRVGGFGRVSFEDVFAPDAFGVQLLGAGYRGRVPEAPSYRSTSIGPDALLLEHVDPAAWFDEPFVPYGKAPVPDAPPPAVLATARAELGPILYTPGALVRAGYVGAPEI